MSPLAAHPAFTDAPPEELVGEMDWFAAEEEADKWRAVLSAEMEFCAETFEDVTVEPGPSQLNSHPPARRLDLREGVVR
ncbi:MAG TPA: hypothetical protein G4N98_05865 [Thermoflexia bacterium]|nr:hypothetical protein [Thermoflexia bacterium]